MSQLAFPTAYGAGAYTEGGRGGEVIHVTNLNDSGAGSLRWALTDSSNKGLKRTIVFDVSGLITLSSDIYVSNMPGDEGGYADGISILAQSAPEGGITITGGKIKIWRINQIVSRYLKFRETTSVDGCFSAGEANNIVFDHMSGSHTSDIVFSVVGNTYTGDEHTIQNCLFGESKNGLIVGDTGEETNGSYGSVSVLRNAYYNVSWRAPMKMGGSMEIDAINNIVHNWKYRAIRADAFNFSLNHIGNYYQAGVDSRDHLNTCYVVDGVTPQIYNYDNYISPEAQPVGYSTDETLGWHEFQVDDYITPLPSSYFTTTQFTLRGRAISILPSSLVADNILPLVGASQYIKDDSTVGFYRDSYDTEFVNGITNRLMVVSDTTIQEPIDTISNTRPANFYVSNDHIPEAYFTAKGITGTSTIHNEVQASGYTLLEEYLNQVDGEVVINNGNIVYNLTEQQKINSKRALVLLKKSNI